MDIDIVTYIKEEIKTHERSRRLCYDLEDKIYHDGRIDSYHDILEKLKIGPEF